MTVVYIVIIIILFLAILLFNVASKIIFIFNSDREDITLTLLWLYPFLKSVVTKESSGLVLSIYLLKRKVYRKPLGISKNKNNNMKLIRAANPTNIHVNARYGFHNPFITGVACGAVSAASQLINIDSLQQSPDFTTDNDYIYLNATAKINLGSTLLNLLRA